MAVVGLLCFSFVDATWLWPPVVTPWEVGQKKFGRRRICVPRARVGRTSAALVSMGIWNGPKASKLSTWRKVVQGKIGKPHMGGSRFFVPPPTHISVLNRAKRDSIKKKTHLEIRFGHIITWGYMFKADRTIPTHFGLATPVPCHLISPRCSRGPKSVSNL